MASKKLFKSTEKMRRKKPKVTDWTKKAKVYDWPKGSSVFAPPKSRPSDLRGQSVKGLIKKIKRRTPRKK